MKTKLIFSLFAVTLVTLSFTFISHPSDKTQEQKSVVGTNEQQIIGFISDEVV